MTPRWPVAAAGWWGWSRRRWLAAALGGLAGLGGGQAQAESALVLATTTSVEHSGLMAHLLPRLQRDTGLRVRVVALGTGQALDVARRGDADAVLVHDETAEERFMAEGWGERRLRVMRNDLVLLGPPHDPAGVRAAAGDDAVRALAHLARRRATFVSRADRSGTHLAELRLWQLAGVDVRALTQRRECGCGMGMALAMAAALAAYTLSDRATWLAWRPHEALAVLVERDPRLANPYHVIVVNPARHPHVRAQAARRLAEWLTGPNGQQAIATFRLRGQVAFLPAAG